MKKKIALLLGVSFLWSTFGLAGCGRLFRGDEQKNQEEITVYMPDGAPAVALSKLMSEDTEEDGVSYFVVDATTIASRVTNADEEKNADVCVMPITAASKLLGTGERYKMLALATQGNLFLLSQTHEDVLEAENLQALLGKTVVVKQINEVPGLTLKSILTANGVAWQELKDGVEASAEKVNLAVAAERYDYELVAEPAVSKRLSMNAGWKVVGDIQRLYGADENGECGYPQAAIVAKASFLAENGAWTGEFLDKLSNVGDWFGGANAQSIYDAVVSHFEDEGKAPAFTADVLTGETLGRCGLRFELATDCKDKVTAYLTGVRGVNENAAKIPADAFYWAEAER